VRHCITCRCEQFTPCRVCGVNVQPGKNFPSHRADHPAEPGHDDRCGVCGLPVRQRMGRPTHVFDHEAVT
jgi:hypothetical protein